MYRKIGDSIRRPDSNNNDMPPHSNKPATPLQSQTKPTVGRRMVAAGALIGIAIGGLALVDRFRDRPSGPMPPHEPSQALVSPPAAAPDIPTGKSAQASLPPPPPVILNNETLARGPRAPGTTPLPQGVSADLSAERIASAAGNGYLVQAGVFTSQANAQALQKQLQRAGIEAHLETRVQIGPFKDRREADRTLVRTKKLGINAVLVGSR